LESYLEKFIKNNLHERKTWLHRINHDSQNQNEKNNERHQDKQPWEPSITRATKNVQNPRPKYNINDFE
jgi:hypothetical protein